jgi:phosphohistidine phosphatase
MPNTDAGIFRLYLVRHAHAAWGSPGVSDFDRPLDDRGRHEARDIAEQAMLAGLAPDFIVTSPAQRCRQTTAALLEVFRAVQPVEDLALYSGGTEAYLAHILEHAGRGSLMIVGHNPMVEAVAHHIARMSDVLAPLAAGYPTAGLLAIDIARPRPDMLAQTGEPVVLVTPSLT